LLDLFVLPFFILPIDLFWCLPWLVRWNRKTEPSKPTPNSSVFVYVENQSVVDFCKPKFTGAEQTESIRRF